ncbi:MAG: hypothetical protein WCJ45_07740 [bacterium]
MGTTTIQGVANLSKTFQTLVESSANTYKTLKTLTDPLNQQKTYIVSQFQTELDGYLADTLQKRYDRNKYLALKKEVAAYKSRFFTTTNQLNCSNILATDTGSASLLAKIAAMKIVASSGLAKITADGITSAFKDQVYS